MKKTFKQFSILIFFALLIFFPTLQHLYLDIDEVLWAEFAHAVLNGCPPYVCVMGEKPPLLYLTYAGFFKLFGMNNYFALHFFHIFWVSCTALLINIVFQSATSPHPKMLSHFPHPQGERGSKSLLLGEKVPVRRMRGGYFTLLPGLFYILLFALPEFRTLAATGESLMNLFLVASFYLFLSPLPPLTKGGLEGKSPPLVRGARGDLTRWLFIGTFVGLASLYRHQAAIQLCVYLFVIFHFKSPLPLRERVSVRGQITFLLLSGFFLTWIVMAAILYLWGSWPAFWQWGILHNFGYIQSGANAPGVWLTALENLGLFFGKTIVFWLLLIISLFPSPLEGEGVRRTGEGRNPIWLYLLTALLAAIPGFRFFPHYFIQAFPPLAILVTLALQRMKFPLWAKIGLILSLSLALFQNFTVSQTLEKDSTKDYSSINKKVGEYIKQNSSAEDKITVWGWGQGIYAYSNRRMSTRYIASDFLTGRIPASDAKQYFSIEEAQKFIKPQAWEYFFEELEKNKPLYFVNTAPENMHDYERFPPEAYPRLMTYLNKHYFFETQIEKIELYRRK